MIEAFRDIPGYQNWNIIKQINKGWSEDKKYHIKTVDGKELLLRISEIEEYEKKKMEFESLKLLIGKYILPSRPIDFGVCNHGKLVYSLLTWIKGEDAEVVIPKLTKREQYNLGMKAGLCLKEIHKLSAPENEMNWETKFNTKIDKKLANYKSCGIRFCGDQEILKYIEENRSLLTNRPQSFQHGDYHVGNMIITPEGELGVIDFNRMDYGDPWEEFNRITFSVSTSPVFASGYINGYFDHKVPDLFFRLMALYIATNQISSIPWAIPYGEKELNIMIRHGENVSRWYDNFKTHIPNWYVTSWS